MPARNIALTIMVAVDENDTPTKIAVKGANQDGTSLEMSDCFMLWLIGAQWVGQQEKLSAKQRAFASSVFTQYTKHVAEDASAPCQVCGVTLAKHSALAGHPHVPVPRAIAARRAAAEKAQ